MYYSTEYIISKSMSVDAQTQFKLVSLGIYVKYL